MLSIATLADDNSDEAEAVPPLLEDATFMRPPFGVGDADGVGLAVGVGVADGVGVGVTKFLAVIVTLLFADKPLLSVTVKMALYVPAEL